MDRLKFLWAAGHPQQAARALPDGLVIVLGHELKPPVNRAHITKWPKSHAVGSSRRKSVILVVVLFCQFLWAAFHSGPRAPTCAQLFLALSEESLSRSLTRPCRAPPCFPP